MDPRLQTDQAALCSSKNVANHAQDKPRHNQDYQDVKKVRQITQSTTQDGDEGVPHPQSHLPRVALRGRKLAEHDQGRSQNDKPKEEEG